MSQGGEYCCAAAYPAPSRTLELGRRNALNFRLLNTRFDVIGGALYFALVVSVVPRCGPREEGGVGSSEAVLDAKSPAEAARAFAAAVAGAATDIFAESTLSLLALLGLLTLCLGFARAGGVGAFESGEAAEAAGRRRRSSSPTEGSSSSSVGSGSGGGAGEEKGSSSSSADPSKPLLLPPFGIEHRQQQHQRRRRRRRRTLTEFLSLKARSGGLATQLLFAGAHAGAHLCAALVLAVALDVGVETVARHASLYEGGSGMEGASASSAASSGSGGSRYHSLFRWYERFEEQHFPDPAGLRSALRSATWGVYPGALKVAMALYDVPEAVAVGRGSICAVLGRARRSIGSAAAEAAEAAAVVAAAAAGAGNATSSLFSSSSSPFLDGPFSSYSSSPQQQQLTVSAAASLALSRAQAIGFYGGMLAYYWLLATPVVGVLFGCYLYACCNWLGVHHDEAFSALRVREHKGFTRIRVAASGDLHVYTVATDDVPSSWREDPRWRGPRGGGGGSAALPHEAAHPSRWAPADAVVKRPGGGEVFVAQATAMMRRRATGSGGGGGVGGGGGSGTTKNQRAASGRFGFNADFDDDGETFSSSSSAGAAASPGAEPVFVVRDLLVVPKRPRLAASAAASKALAGAVAERRRREQQEEEEAARNRGVVGDSEDEFF